MPSLKDLTLSIGCSLLEWAEEVSKLLKLDMPMLHTFSLYIKEMSDSNAKLLVDTLLLQIRGLRIFKPTIEEFGLTKASKAELAAMEHLCRYLKAPSCVLTLLSFMGHVSDNAVSLLASVLAENNSLETLRFRTNNRPDSFLPQPSGMGSIADALRSNTTLKTLAVSETEIGALEMEKLVGALIPDSSGSQPNSTLTELDLSGCRVLGRNGVEYLCTLIKCNISLVELGVSNWLELKEGEKDSSYLALENVEKLLTSLQSNRTLKYLDLGFNTGIGGKKVLGMIMDMLLHNHTVVNINLFGTDLQKEGDAEIVYAELRKRRNRV